MAQLERANPLTTWQELRQTEREIASALSNWSWAQTDADEEYFWGEYQRAKQHERDLRVKVQRERDDVVPLSLRRAAK